MQPMIIVLIDYYVSYFYDWVIIRLLLIVRFFWKMLISISLNPKLSKQSKVYSRKLSDSEDIKKI